MTNDIFNQQNSDVKPSNLDQADVNALAALFANVRESEPVICDANFSKIIANSLPANPKRRQSRSLMFDCVGLILGLMAAYWFFDLSQLAQSALSFVPESLSITVAHIVSIFIGAVILAVAGWWTAEKGFS